MRLSIFLLSVFVSSAVWAGIPATPVLTLYQFNGPLEIPYYDLDTFRRSGPSLPAGTLTQGSSVIPCLVVLDGKALTDDKGTPFVGFQVVVDSRTATISDVERFQQALRQRSSMTVANHHCDPGVKTVIDVRKLYPLKKVPFFEPQPARIPTAKSKRASQGELDEIIRAFHNSPQCELANRSLIERRSALQRAWDRFAAASQGHWPMSRLEHARHLDYVLRTAIFEGHQDRGCNAYGSCERNVIALSIRNRGLEHCLGRQGCREKGDFEGVSSNVSQYNIWDENLTQISGLTTCFLRDDLVGGPKAELYRKLQGMYEQSFADVQAIVFGGDRDLLAVFPGNDLADLKALRHYYHAPAMGKCFPNHDRVEFISGAVAKKGNDFALLANTRIRVDQPTEGGYFFRAFRFEAKDDHDEVEIVDSYPGFVVDARKVELNEPRSCKPYGIPSGCPFETIGRYRTTPSWLSSGRPLEVICNVKDRGESCQGAGIPKTAKVGGMCDTQMRPVAGIK
jgi:hypothetical protein